MADDARDDNFATDELTSVGGNLFADNGNGADSGTLTIAEVNGNAASVGTQITLASGALLTVNADGTFTYDPNGAFQTTPAQDSGAPNWLSFDSFTYTLAGGGTATVHLNISGVDNNDFLFGSSGDDSMSGGIGNDAVYGFGGNDTLNGNAGSDLIRGGFGDDIIDGGDGNDRAGYYQNNPTIGGVTVSLLEQNQWQDTGTQGSDYLTNIENLSGTPFADVLTGDDNDNWLWGSPSTITPGNVSSTNNDQLYGMGGNDLLVVGIGNHYLDGGTESDTVRFTENGVPESGVTIDLGLQGSAQDTGQGMWTLTNIENLSGGTGGDSFFGDFNANVLAGDVGNDSLLGGFGNDTLYGDGRIAIDANGVMTTYADVAALGEADGNDVLSGGRGDDSLYGGGGADLLNGGFGDDVVDGGSGNDRAGFYQPNPSFGGVTVSLLEQGHAQDTGQGMDTLTGIENLSGTPFADTLTGDAGDNWLWGSAATIGPGNISATNNDQLYGMGGNDLLVVGIGNHTIDGGADNDTLRFTENGAPEGAVSISLLNPGVAQNTGQGTWTISGIENLSGGIANDILTGDGNANILAGDSGDDALNGGGGNDTLYGDGRIATDQNNVITTTGDIVSLPNAGAPGNGNDTLDGGVGADTMVGGGGNDTYFVDNIGDVVVEQPGEGVDTVNTSLASYTLGANVENLTGLSATTLVGNGLDNMIVGGSANSSISGGVGDDTINPGLGTDTVSGGTGNDTLVVDYGSLATVVKMTAPTAAGDGSIGSSKPNSVTFTSIESFVITTGSAGDSIATGSGNDTINTGAGNDTINSGAGSDHVSAGDGTDTIQFVGSFGSDDFVDGGAGSDTLSLSGGASATMSGVTNVEMLSLAAGASYALTAVDSNIAAGATLTVNANGLKASDAFIFNGAAESDGRFSITSGAGNDALTGGAGADTINGGAGNDTIVGGGGDDTLTGGNGADIFAFGASSGHDRISDFTSSDRISFGSSSGVTSFAQLTISQVGRDTVISWGTGDTITLAGVRASAVNQSEFQFGGSFAAVQQSSLPAESGIVSADHANLHASFAVQAGDYFFG